MRPTANKHDLDSSASSENFICIMGQFAPQVEPRQYGGTFWRVSMSPVFKSTALGLGLLVGAAFAAQAQTGSVAALPPSAAPSAAAPLAPLNPYPGPNPGAGVGIPTGQTQAAVAPSPAMPGVNPGLGYYGTPERYQTPAGYEQNTAAHPYSSPGVGPRAN
jgi:hypothetical protein